MRILFLSQRFVLPMDTGGKIRTGKILEQLARSHEITLISNVESPKDDKYLPEIQKLCSRFVAVPWREIRRYSLLFFFRLFFQNFSRYPVTVLNTCSRPLRDALEREYANGSYDIAICDFVQPALMFVKLNSVPSLLFQHNVESMISKRHIEQAGNPIAKLFWWLQWKKLDSYEAKQARAFDTVIAVSDTDTQTFRDLYKLENVVSIPTGVDVDYFTPTADCEEDQNSLVFCGSMDWLPNEDGIIFFVNEILPKIRKDVASIQLTIVGRNPSPSLLKIISKDPAIKLTGWVEDTRPYIARSALFIVPLRIGGGTRMKIYEAMAMGKTVVSTSIGAEGLPVTSDENIIIEDDATRFAEKVVELLRDGNKRDLIGSSARKFVSDNYSWDKVAREFSRICSTTARTKRRPAA